MVGEVRPFGELFAEPTRNGLTRPSAVRGVGVKMVNMGELFAYPRLFNAPMDRVPLNESESQRFLLREGDLLFARQSLVFEGAGKCSVTQSRFADLVGVHKVTVAVWEAGTKGMSATTDRLLRIIARQGPEALAPRRKRPGTTRRRKGR